MHHAPRFTLHIDTDHNNVCDQAHKHNNDNDNNNNEEQALVYDSKEEPTSDMKLDIIHCSSLLAIAIAITPIIDHSHNHNDNDDDNQHSLSLSPSTESKMMSVLLPPLGRDSQMSIEHIVPANSTLKIPIQILPSKAPTMTAAQSPLMVAVTQG